MSDTDTLAGAITTLLNGLADVARSLDPGRRGRVLESLGVRISGADADLDAAIDGLIALSGAAASLADAVADGNAAAIALAIAAAVDDLTIATRRITGLDFSGTEVTELFPGALATIGSRLLDHVMLRMQANQVPLLDAAARLVGLVDTDMFTQDITDEDYEDPIAYWVEVRRMDRLRRLVDPAALLVERTGWGQGGSLAPLLDDVRVMCRRLGLVADSVDNGRGGVDLVLGFGRAGEPVSATLTVTPTESGGVKVVASTDTDADAEIVISELATLSVEVPDVALATVVAEPGAPIEIEGLDGATRAGVTLRWSDPIGRVTLLREGELLTVEAAAVELSAGLTIGGAEIEADFALTVDDMQVVIGSRGADSFLASLLPASAAATFDIGIDWSSQSGFHFQGGATFDIVIPVHRSLGPIGLELFHVQISLGEAHEIIAQLTADVSTTLLVFSVDVEGFGVRSVLSFPESGGNLGPFDLSFGFTPPSRVAFELSAGAVNGRGFVEHVADSGRYVGGLSLDIVAVGVDALAIVDTRLPGDPDGFALFASLSLRFPSIPLGFGFSLSGLGGLLALNRGVDTEALALGMRDGAADAILFPVDPLRDAALLVPQIDAYFPLLSGNTVVGPVAEVRWGVGDILVGQLGLAISLPQGLIIVLGSIEAILPDRVAPVLELHLDVLGVLDMQEGSLLIMGSLYDSRLLGVLELSGDTALYVSWLDNPYFVLSVGGFHPGFTPPNHVPSVLEHLRRMRAAIDLGLGVTAAIETYFAVTSNTVQFGGGFEIEASTRFLLVEYTARGWFDFDVLLRFAPFLILADASAGVGVYANDKELLGVHLAVHLEGPEPWFASGKASFKFFGVKVNFDFAVGAHAPPEIRGSSDVLGLAQAELSNPAAWTAQPAAKASAGLLLASATSGKLIRPDDVLVGKQTVAPLGREIARLGETTPLQTELSIAAARLVALVGGEAGEAIGELEVADAFDWFAPAQYDVMSDRSRLSSPSYEQMVAGVSIGSQAVALPADGEILAAEGHETKVWAPATHTSTQYFGVKAARPLANCIAASAAAEAASRTRGAGIDVARIQLAGQAYITVDATTGRTLTEEQPYAAAVAAARDHVGVRVVPAHAGRES